MAPVSLLNAPASYNVPELNQEINTKSSVIEAKLSMNCPVPKTNVTVPLFALLMSDLLSRFPPFHLNTESTSWCEERDGDGAEKPFVNNCRLKY